MGKDGTGPARRRWISGAARARGIMCAVFKPRGDTKEKASVAMDETKPTRGQATLSIYKESHPNSMPRSIEDGVGVPLTDNEDESQDKPVFVHRLIAENTVEAAIQRMQARKQALADALFDGTGKGPLAISEADLDALFAASPPSTPG